MYYPSLKRHCLSVLTVCALLNTFGQLSGSTLQESKQSKKASFVYVYDGIPGFAELKAEEASGLVIDIMRDFETYVKKREGIEVSSQFVLKENFADFLASIKNAKGGVFGLSNISITQERKANFNFSPPYLDNVSILLSNNKAKTLTSMENISQEFAGMIAYSLPSSSYLRRLNEIKRDFFPGLEIVILKSETEILERLSNDEKAFGIVDVNYYISVLKNKQNIKRHAIGDFSDDQFGILMPKDCDWASLLEDFFNSELIGTSRYSQIISDNLGSTALRLLESIKQN